MAIETNLNQSPYFDDFNEDKNFHRVLFRPGYAVQARELTQLQTILQNQIERFANEVLVDGTVVTGCGLITTETQYVKLRDKDANNRVILLSDFYSGSRIANVTITGATSGVTGKLVAVLSGSEAQAPNYFTVYCHYTNSGANNTTKAFIDNETLLFRNSSDSSFVVAANTITSSATGKALKASISDGIYYHKGHFIRIDSQSTIAGRYTTTPNVQIGITTSESKINSNADESLLDNATGASNYTAPGADRLKLTGTITVANVNYSNTVSYFSVAKIENGQVITKMTDTTYSDIGKEFARRMYDTNGNFVTEPFNLRIREHLKKDNSLGRYTTAEGGDADKLVVEVERGAGYVGGYKIELQNIKTLETDKATDYFTKDALVLGQAFGNYVIGREVVGTWDVKDLGQVSLYSAAQNGISGKNFGNQAAQGTAIGTANVRGIQWESGTAGTVEGKYRIYLYNVQMNSGYSFADVRSIWVDNGAYNSMADIVLTNGSAKLQETNLNTMIFPLGQRATKTIKDATDTVDTQFVYRAAKQVNVPTDSTFTVTLGTPHAGGTETMNETGSPLSNTIERNIIVVSRTATYTDNHTGIIAAFSGNTITGNSTVFTSTYQVGDLIKIVDGANTVVERITSIPSDYTIKVANTISYNRTGVSLGHATDFPAGYVFDLSANGTVTSTSSQHSIDLQQANLASTFEATVYYNVLRSDAVQTAKTVNKNKFIHINTGSHSASKTGPWSLGVSDAFKLVSVYKGTNTAVTTSDTDVTSHFELDTGMKDAFYDTSYLKQKATSTLDLTNCGLMVKFNYFGRDRSAGIGYLSVDSYPIDDTNVANTTAITTQEIPLFVSPTTDRVYDLRDSIDMRPIKDNSVTPSATGTVGSAPTNPAASTTFNVESDGAFMPTPDENFQCDAQFYLPRQDRVALTPSGNFLVVKGVSDLSPRAPSTPAGSMTLGTLRVPPYPSLSPYVAKVYNRNDYAVRLTLENNRRYTMADLRAVEDRVKSLEYYSTLNLLETQAKNKQIFSDTTGADRYKNGFFVDGFGSHINADVRNPNYRAAIDRQLAKLRPTYLRADVPMAKDVSLSSSNVTKTGDLVTLSYTHASFINQPYASKLRNPVQELMFNWTGEVILDPPQDNTPDITQLPEIQVDFNGFYDAIEFIANETGVTGTDWGAWRTISSSSRSTTGAAIFNQIDNTWGDWLRQTTTTVTTSTQEQTGVVTTLEGASETISFGPLVENVMVRDYMRAREIRFTGVRMRPNTRVYAYFDDEKVSAYCTPANSTFGTTGVEGDALITDSTGTVYGTFRLPDDENLRFRVGTKRFKLQDINDPITQEDLVTTSAHGDYTSIPLDVLQKSASIEMTVPQFSQETVTRRRTVTSVSTSTRVWDPLAQSFTVVTPDEVDGVYITKCDVFFGNKSSSLPITLQIREVENGYPTEIIVPYGSKTLQPSEISANSTVATNATTFTFNSPVFLQNDKDYAMVLLPGGNSDDYTVWTAELGGYDVDAPDTIIDKQTAAGILFVSSNDKTWKPIQNEDLKFNLYRANFSTSTGTVYIENKDVDYFTIDNIESTFRVGETLRAESIMKISNTTSTSIAVGTTLKSKAVVDGEPVTNASYANGIVREIVSSNTSTVTVKIDAFGTFSNTTTASEYNLYNGSGTLVGTTNWFAANTATGKVSFFYSSANKLYVDDSTGSFANGWVRGQSSGAYCRVVTIDNLRLNTLVPKIPQITHSKTQAAWGARTTSTSGTISSSYSSVLLSQDNNFYDGEKKVYSKSNEDGLTPVGGSDKSLVLRGTFNTDSTFVSPVIDTSRSNSIILANEINNLSTDEHKAYGDAKVRYISKKITLADGQDAEDLVVYINAFKPRGTDVKVYAKILNGEDGEAFTDKDYTPLTQITSSNTYSSGFDGTDTKEFEFGFSANTDGQGFLVSANNHARLNSSNNNIVAYRGNDGSIYHTFKTYAIKIVLTADGSNLVPLVNDLRAIALQK